VRIGKGAPEGDQIMTDKKKKSPFARDLLDALSSILDMPRANRLLERSRM
jgi:hypothetical protein